MSKERTELTEDQYVLFQEEAEYWLDKFNLRNWEVYYGRISDKEGEEGEGFADCRADGVNRVACLRLALSYYSVDKLRFPRVIHKAAFHEVCELMLSDLRSTSRYAELETDAIVHEIIRRLEHTVFIPDWQQRQTQGEQDHGKGRNEP